MMRRATAVLATVSVMAWAAGCSPALDWRVVRPEPDTQLQFPCKPDRLERQVALLERTVPARMWVCEAGGLTWSATVFELRDPALAEAGLRELHQKLLFNMKGSGEATERLDLAGATPDVPALRVRISGVRPDGAAASAQALFAARGLRLYQLVVMTRQDAPAQWSTQAGEFLDALHWPG